MLDFLLALIIALVSPSMGCKSAHATDPATPPQDSTPTAPDSTVPAPRGAATLDGTFSRGEWEGAYVAPLVGGGEIRLMHDAGYLYLGVRRRPFLVVDVCLDRGDSVAVLHSSAAIGTTVYRRALDGWELVREFAWSLRDSTMSAAAQEEREAYLRREGWVATNTYVGAAADTEFKIAMPSGRARLAALPSSVGEGYHETVSWPSALVDGCRTMATLPDRPPAQIRFTPERWINVVAAR